MPRAAAIHPDTPDLPPLTPPEGPVVSPSPADPSPEPGPGPRPPAGVAAPGTSDDLVNKARHLVANYPMASLGATTAIGALLGFLLKRMR